MRYCALCEKRVESCEHREGPAHESVVLPREIPPKEPSLADSELKKIVMANDYDYDDDDDDDAKYGVLDGLMRRKEEQRPTCSSSYGLVPLRSVEHERPLVMLPFCALGVAAFMTINIQIPAQVFLDLRRLVYAGPPNTFRLKNLSVGNQLIVGDGAGIPMETFPPHPPKGVPIDNLDGSPKCYIGMLIAMQIENIASYCRDFDALIFARGLT